MFFLIFSRVLASVVASNGTSSKCYRIHEVRARRVRKEVYLKGWRSEAWAESMKSGGGGGVRWRWRTSLCMRPKANRKKNVLVVRTLNWNWISLFPLCHHWVSVYVIWTINFFTLRSSTSLQRLFVLYYYVSVCECELEGSISYARNSQFGEWESNSSSYRAMDREKRLSIRHLLCHI